MKFISVEILKSGDTLFIILWIHFFYVISTWVFLLGSWQDTIHKFFTFYFDWNKHIVTVWKVFFISRIYFRNWFPVYKLVIMPPSMDYRLVFKLVIKPSSWYYWLVFKLVIKPPSREYRLVFKLVIKPSSRDYWLVFKLVIKPSSWYYWLVFKLVIKPPSRDY